MTKALVIGIDSGIGGALASALLERGDTVYGTTRRAGRSRHILLDLSAPNAAATPLPEADVTVFCAAIARFAECREQPEHAHLVNVANPVALARRLSENGSRVVLLSTSAVFDGTRPYRRAVEPPCPVSAYGRLKAEAEAGFLQLGADAAVLRLTKVIPPQMPLFTDWAKKVGEGQSIEAFTDLFFCPITLNDAVDALLAVIDNENDGIYQVSGRDDLSYAEAASHLVRLLGADPDLIEKRFAVDNGVLAEDLLVYTSLDVARLSGLNGFCPPTALEVLEKMLFQSGSRRAANSAIPAADARL